MDRAKFLKSLAALGVSAKILRTKTPGTVEIQTQMRPHRGAEPISLTFPVPETLDSPLWEDLYGLNEEKLQALVIQNLTVRLQAQARMACRYNPDATEEDFRRMVREYYPRVSYPRRKT